jgi:replication-associated recombination protein RarA
LDFDLADKDIAIFPGQNKNYSLEIDQADKEFKYKPGVIFCNLLLADEINRTSAKTQSALLEAMEEKRVTVDGTTYEDAFSFIFITYPCSSVLKFAKGTNTLLPTSINHLNYQEFCNQIFYLIFLLCYL